MDILTVCGKPYPQKVVLDTDVLTRSGELFPAGSDIFVLLCVKPLFCTDARCYHNVNLSRRNDTEEKVYINPESEELILDTQYRDKTYNTVEELCEDRPRFFSCQEDFFAMDTNDCMVSISSGQKFELMEIKNADKLSINDGPRFCYTNVDIPKKACNTHDILLCCCEDTKKIIQILPTCKSKFKSVEDPNTYKVKDLLNMVELPRQVKLQDECLYRIGASYLRSHFVNLEKKSTNFFLFFTTKYVADQSSVIQLRHQIKCAELTNPKNIKLRTRVNNNFGEQFDTTFIFEYPQDGRISFSLLGRKNPIPISRTNSGRQNYLSMKKRSSDPDVDSGFVESMKSRRSASLPSGRMHADKVSQPDYLLGVQNIADDNSGEYVAISIDRNDTPPLPDRKYLENVQQQPKNTSPVVTGKASHLVKGNAQHTGKSSDHDLDKKVAKAQHAKGFINSKSGERHNLKSQLPTVDDSGKLAKSSSSVAEGSSTQLQSSQDETTLQNMSITELTEFLKCCKLHKLADTCIDEGVDGDLFLELSEEVLQDEPFELNKFEILKVNRIKGGWKPKQ